MGGEKKEKNDLILLTIIFSLSLSLSLYLSIYLSLSLSLSLCLSICLYLSIYLSLSLSVCAPFNFFSRPFTLFSSSPSFLPSSLPLFYFPPPFLSFPSCLSLWPFPPRLCCSISLQPQLLPPPLTPPG